MVDLQLDRELQQEFRDWFENGKIKGVGVSDQAVKPFYMPAQKVVEYFKAGKKINQLLRRLAPDQNLEAYQSTIVKEYRNVLCILVIIGQGHHIGTFVKHARLRDDGLPFEHRPTNFPFADDGNDFFERFKEVQWQFCAEPFTYNMTRQYEDARVLPIMTKDQIGNGGSSNIFKITIPQGYDELEPPGGSEKKNPSFRHAHTYVLKTYRTGDAKSYYNNETRAFRRILAAGDNQGSVRGLIGFHGNFTHGGTYNILLEYADKGTLEDYFQQVSPPVTEESIISFWCGLFYPIFALLKIHGLEEEDLENPGIYQGWHQDIKPQNILVVSSDRPSPYKYEFKLADLGLSHFKKPGYAKGELTDTDTYGTRTYGAPESYRSDNLVGPSNIRVKKSVDIWSLGCVYSEAAAWLVLGKEGLDQYRKEREQETKSIPNFKDDGCFHNGSMVLKSVDVTHAKVVSSKRRTDHITRHVLQTMVQEMLGVESVRPRAMQLWQKSQIVLKQARERQSSIWSSSVDSKVSSKAPTLQSPQESSAPEVVPQREASHAIRSERAEKTTTHHLGQLAEGRRRLERSPERMATERSPQQPLGGPVLLEQSPDLMTGANRGASSFPNPEPRTPASVLTPIQSPPRTPVVSQPIRLRNYLTVESAMLWKDRQRHRGLRSKTAPDGGKNFMNQIQQRDHVFVVDDSTSMRSLNWAKVVHKFDLLAYIVKEADPDGLDLYFSTSCEKIHSRKTSELTKAVTDRGKQQMGSTNLRVVLKTILDEFRTSVYGDGRKRGSLLSRFSSTKQRKPMTCYILTDGAWFLDENWTIETVIKEFVDELIQLKTQEEEFGIQFISFGNNELGLEHLEHLDSRLGLPRDIIDTEPADRNVWKMLLGSINKGFDADPKDQYPKDSNFCFRIRLRTESHGSI